MIVECSRLGLLNKNIFKFDHDYAYFTIKGNCVSINFRQCNFLKIYIIVKLYKKKCVDNFRK